MTGFLSALFSDDAPRSRVLTVLLLAIVVGLAATPFVFPGSTALNTAAKVCVFVVLVASYDILLGYTGIVSFAHTMFFGIGAYGVGLTLAAMGPSFGAVALGLGAALAVGLAFAVVIGLVSLRVKAIFFAMITLAVASAFAVLVSQLSDLTGGEDGRSFKVPALLAPAYRPFAEPVFGVTVNGRILAYYLILASAIGLFLLALRLVNSPFGRVLQAIRENEDRAEALGYRVVAYRTGASCLAAGLAVLAGALEALWLRYVGPDTTLSFSIMTDVLLMVVIGGMGTLWGSVIGATLFVVAQSYLQKAMAAGSSALEGVPILPNLIHPDRWFLFLGILFVASVYFFPTGIVGRLRRPRAGDAPNPLLVEAESEHEPL